MIMPANIKTLWVEALRSGRFEQGRGRLASGPEYRCCLGVLVQVLAENGAVPEECEVRFPEEEWKGIDIKYREDSYFVCNMDTVPFAWREDLGLLTRVKTEMFEEDNAHDFLINRNDAREGTEGHFSFEEIADWIEKNL